MAAAARAIGLSRSERTTRLHAAVDECGRPRRLILGPGHRGEAPVALDLIGSFAPSLCLADAGYDSRAIRARVIASGGTPVIRNHTTRKHPHAFDGDLYRNRNVIERTFCRLKDWRRMATRYGKLARNFLAGVIIASIVIYRS